ncbi:hypothetical protein CBS101457_004866 [Exobasidium rhododendri]|nr:hypothetical protein CBS101457_004866 [Exobasidium rhododendri]
MRFLLPLSLFILLLFVLSAIARPSIDSGNAVVVFQPPTDWIRDKVLSARSLLLNDGTILVSFDTDPPSGQVAHLAIHRSTDGGKTFEAFSQVVDTQDHGPMRYQSHLFLLEKAFGDFPAGTVLLAGNAVPDDHETSSLDLYASSDSGKTWSFVSTIASGGAAIPVNGFKAVWEPFLFRPSEGDRIYCFYSDQRDPRYGQKIVHTSTADLRAWSPVVDDVTARHRESRPGMPVVSELSNGNFFMTYEYFGAPERPFAVYHKTSSNPDSWLRRKGSMIKTTTGEILTSSPYHVLSSAGGKAGTLILNAGSSSKLYTNKRDGAGPWAPIQTQAPASYSRGLALAENPGFVMITGGGPIGDQGAENRVTFTMTRVI